MHILRLAVSLFRSVLVGLRGTFRRRLESRLLFRCHFGLVALLPFALRHAVDQLARSILIEGNAILCRGFAIPVSQAVAAEARQSHQIDILHIRPSAKMRHESTEYSSFQLFARALIHLGVP